MTNDIAHVVEFWCDKIGPEGWYKSDADLDREIRARFLDLWDDGMAGRLWLWQHSAPGALALAILLDQFPRNMFRGEAAAFRSDPLARRAVKGAIGRGFDLQTPEPERQFFYLPLMHSEILADQERCVRLILTQMPEAGGDNLPHAVKHRAVIRRFGRFPSRNKALGRRDTSAEIAYRAEGGYMSGAPASGPG